MNMNKTAKWLRFLVLIGLLIWVTYESYLHQMLGGGKVPSVHALCPYGALESLYAMLFMGSFIQKIYSGTVVLLILTILIAILFRRSFCGMLCPFGALQEVFARIGQKILKNRFKIPKKFDRPLRYLKYIIFVITLGMAWYYGTLWMDPYDPYSAYAHITSISESINEKPIAIVGFILLAITIIASVFYDRFFCKYLCPAGAFYGIIGKISPTKIERNDNLCVHCKACNKACPMNIDVEKTDKVTDIECINCNECVVACPKKGALEAKTAKKVLHPLAMLIIVVGMFFGTILIAQITGNYEIMPKELESGQVIPITEVKGYHSIEEAAKFTGLSLQEIYEKFGIPNSVSKSTKMKDISKEVPGYNFDESKAKAGLTESNTNGAKTQKEGNASNKVDVSGIKGSMTIREAAESINMDIKEFYKLFKIPENVPSQTQMKNISNVSSGYDFEKIKESLR